ncbi:polar amino acid ABC transporter, inner membrane subunit [Kribbella flavida DSM 17836]|uniref:Polar amino acid ABC transporter, inner membrane subunit n=1 Tax=Kribbella flavida (strain DSM 17836 / JCM 10339 / NBRC 14399) TaxID=479435 RepID=D2PZD9_KRIFD|nr:amino acid ABC transporter permease [Kribbella flavida]ADB33748.1 polar amino acid ABC transporter, inner membrane subunit [Kribbella flavida DSM 17836]
MSAVLYDVPGPRAKARNRILNVIVLALLAAGILWLVLRLNSTGQFEGRRWAQFQYTAIQEQLLTGLLNTLRAAGAATVLALIFGAVFAAARISDHRWLRVPATFVVELFRAIPLLILMFFFYYGSLEFELGLSPFHAVVFGLTLYNGSVLAEIFRAGIAAVPKGQREAAYATGLRKNQVVRLVLLPQAIRAMLPAIVSQLVVLLKDTALGFIITYNELLYVAKQMGGRLEFGFPYIPTYIVIAVIYIGLCSLLSLLARYLEGRSRRSRKVTGGPPPAAAESATSAEAPL